MTEEAKEKYRQLIREVVNNCPYYELLGIEVVSLSERESVVKLPFKEDLLQPARVVHGGAISSVADSAVALALLSALPAGSDISTIEMKMNFIAPVAGGEMIARARIVHLGGRTAVGEVKIVDGDGGLIAVSLQTYSVRRPE